MVSDYIRQLYEKSKVQTLVEHKLQFNTDQLELNLFETREKTFSFPLEFNDLSLISMFNGKKVMHIDKKEAFDFHPQESLVLDRHTSMQIDFPNADLERPTTCMALLIDQDEVQGTLALLNERHLKHDHGEWQLYTSPVKFQNDQQLQGNISKIIKLASSDHPHKRVLSKLATQELIIHLMQTHARSLLMQSAQQMSTHNPLAYAIQYIRDHIFEKLDIGKIAGKAFMSKATFFRHFKMETGITPGDFILREKINQAKILLRQQHRTISDIAYTLSFNSASHFVQLFKKFTGSTPNKFRRES